jgi:hypothetical protein
VSQLCPENLSRGRQADRFVYVEATAIRRKTVGHVAVVHRRFLSPYQSDTRWRRSGIESLPDTATPSSVQLPAVGVDIRDDTYDFVKPEQFDLSTRRVLVTSASKGLGKANAISFARAGASEIAIAARSGLEDVEKQIREAAQKAGRKEPTILSLKLDVSDRQSVRDAVAKIEQDFGSLDIVINNAGASAKWVREQR